MTKLRNVLVGIAVFAVSAFVLMPGLRVTRQNWLVNAAIGVALAIILSLGVLVSSRASGRSDESDGDPGLRGMLRSFIRDDDD